MNLSVRINLTSTYDSRIDAPLNFWYGKGCYITNLPRFRQFSGHETIEIIRLVQVSHKCC